MSQSFTNYFNYPNNPTFGSITFSPTTQGVKGTTAADNAQSGYVGEVISSQVLFASAVSLVTNTNKDVTSITLTAGDWDVVGNITYTASVATSSAFAWINTVSITTPNQSLYVSVASTTGTLGLVCPSQRINVSGNQIVYLSGQATFASGTCTACGLIYARRAR